MSLTSSCLVDLLAVSSHVVAGDVEGMIVEPPDPCIVRLHATLDLEVVCLSPHHPDLRKNMSIDPPAELNKGNILAYVYVIVIIVIFVLLSSIMTLPVMAL